MDRLADTVDWRATAMVKLARVKEQAQGVLKSCEGEHFFFGEELF